MTGAAGSIGSVVAGELSERWDVVATDLRPSADVSALDVTDGAACRSQFAGADAVVHLAANPDPEARWADLHPANVIGVHEVATAAAACGVRRLVLASSLQAVSAYPDDRQLRGTDLPLPANLYGATKAWAEAVGAWISSTSETTVVALRIGFFNASPPAGPNVSHRDVAAWLSPRDCVELVRAAVEGPVERFVIINGVSRNRYRKAEHGLAEASIGFRPQDDAWDAP